VRLVGYLKSNVFLHCYHICFFHKCLDDGVGETLGFRIWMSQGVSLPRKETSHDQRL